MSISVSKYKELQKLFFSKVTECGNPSTVNLKYIEIKSSDAFSDFIGEGKREPGKEYSFACFYTRNISDKQREKMGIADNVTDVIYISPLEVAKKTGSSKLPDFLVNSTSQTIVEFLGATYEIVNIIDLEPMHNGKEWVCLAYQFNCFQKDIAPL